MPRALWGFGRGVRLDEVGSRRPPVALRGLCRSTRAEALQGKTGHSGALPGADAGAAGDLRSLPPLVPGHKREIQCLGRA